VVDGARALLEGLDPWELAAVEQLTYGGKSLLLALALLRGLISLPGKPQPGGLPPPGAGPLLGVEQGMAAARLEELFQTDEWGEVEAGHDLDKANMASCVAAPVVMMRLLRLRDHAA
jgi:ATP synthase F1 complex assembly factor 2